MRFVLFQVWEPAPPLYETTFYVVGHQPGGEPLVHAERVTYYAVPLETLARLMEKAGFKSVRRIDEVYFQPVIAGRKLIAY